MFLSQGMGSQTIPPSGDQTEWKLIRPPSGEAGEFPLHFAGSLPASTPGIRKNDFTPAVELETLPAERSGSAYTTPPLWGLELNIGPGPAGTRDSQNPLQNHVFTSTFAILIKKIEILKYDAQNVMQNNDFGTRRAK